MSFGDRKDGYRVRDIHGSNKILIDFKPNRVDAAVYMNETLDVTEFVKKMNELKNILNKSTDLVFKFFDTLHDAFPNINNIVNISHGMVTRYIYHYLTGNKGISAYDVINSNGFKFYNLDLLVYDTETKEIKDYHNRDHITHF